jgi:hypothetical protein
MLVESQMKQGLAKITLTERDELPIDFLICDFKPCHAWRRALVGARHATGIQKQHTSTPFVSRHVRVSVQNNIDVIRHMVRRYVLETEFQSAAHKIDNQWPIEVTIAIATHHGYAGADRAKLVENALCANVAQMPDFIGIFGDFSHVLRQTIVRVRQNKDAQCLI